MLATKESSSSPVFRDIGVLFLSAHAWNSPWRSYHHLLTGLSRFFHVVWCDPAPSLRNFASHQEFLNNFENFSEPIPPGLTVYRPERWLPSIGRPSFIGQWTKRKRLKRGQKLLSSQGCRKTILFLCRPSHAWALDEKDFDLRCYRISDEYTFSEIEQPVGKIEADLISRVDQVFIHSQASLDKKQYLNPETIWAPNGVDYAAYSAPQVEPEDLKGIPHPRIGYVGVLKHQLDLPLLHRLAQRHKDWSFVLVGPQGNLGDSTAWFQRLVAIDNVHWLGGKRQKHIPSYMQHLDVCMLPYKVNGYTKFIYPLKLHEYLASGRPVVGTPIQTLKDFSQAITLASTEQDWSSAIGNSLSSDATSQELIAARRQVARRHDWLIMVDVIARKICEKLGSINMEHFQRSLMAPNTNERSKWSKNPEKRVLA